MKPQDWTPDSWRALPAAQAPPYDNDDEVQAAARALQHLPPLVTSWEIERLKTLLADAQEGRRFVLQGGDCAETVADCRSDAIAAKLKILLQMSLVLVHGLRRPVVRVGRFAGQYAKPRSKFTETHTVNGEEVTLPSYFGDLVNRVEFTAEARRPDPANLVTGYQHAALTLNFIRALVDGGFADLHHPHQWDLAFTREAALSAELRAEYERMSQNLSDGMHLMEALGEARIEELTRVEFFTSHEGLNLPYESALTRSVPRRPGHYNLSTHLPWIGERTRDLKGAHVEFFRGLRNPVGVKLGPTATANDVRSLIDCLNPDNEPGRLVFITRMGAAKVQDELPRLIEAAGKKRVLWICDPMHGNTHSTASGIKTRSFDAILEDLERTQDVHSAAGTWLGGVHFELTGEDVTECVGGAAGLSEDGLDANYVSPCDPRLNYQQSLELAFLLARRMRQTEG
ncbi:MAG: 3-deoxy-7-phosphoheptulonate synthase class II [Planctomycetota bacterium]